MFRRNLLAGVLAGAMLIGGAVTASADNRDFTFTNSSGSVVDQLYVEDSGLPDWGADILGEDTLDAGASANIHFNGYRADSCNYDIKVVFTDESSLEAYQFDLCSIGVVELGNDSTFYYK